VQPRGPTLVLTISSYAGLTSTVCALVPNAAVTGSGGAPTWSPDGRRMVFGAVIAHGGPNTGGGVRVHASAIASSLLVGVNEGRARVARIRIRTIASWVPIAAAKACETPCGSSARKSVPSVATPSASPAC
jgi:hypothetical protein